MIRKSLSQHIAMVPSKDPSFSLISSKTTPDLVGLHLLEGSSQFSDPELTLVFYYISPSFGLEFVYFSTSNFPDTKYYDLGLIENVFQMNSSPFIF